MYLSKIAHTVYLIHRSSLFRGTNDLLTKVKNTPNIKIIMNEEVTNLITKNHKLIGLKLKKEKLDITGLFLYIGNIPNTEFLENTNLLLEDGYIIVNENYETNIPNVYASGDVIKKDVYQIITAASEGAIASINISQN